MKVIFSNLIGFDGLIFIVAAAEIFIFIRAKAAAEALYKAMHKHVYAPSYQDDISSIHEGMESMTDLKLSGLREKAVSAYTIYMNLTGIFPLLGILGTVISLIGMVGNTSDIEGNFFAALTSTFWGLIFAIIFKFMDAFISPKLDDGERAAELFMQRRPSFGNGRCREGADDSRRERQAEQKTGRGMSSGRKTGGAEIGRTENSRAESSRTENGRIESSRVQSGELGKKSGMTGENRRGRGNSEGTGTGKLRSMDSWKNHPDMMKQDAEMNAQAAESSVAGIQEMNMSQPDDVPVFVDDTIDDGEVHE